MARFLFFLVIFTFSTISLSSQDFITNNFSSLDGSDGYSGVADMDGDGNIDIVANSVNRIYIYHHDGTLPINLASISIVPSSSYRAIISLVDKDGDGDMDILATRNNKIIYIVNKSTPGNFLFEIESLPIGFTTTYPHLLGADFDKDGKMDILVGDQTGRVKVFYNRNDTYSEYNVDFILPAPDEANLQALKIADFNGDGMLDIVVGSLFAEKKGLMVYINEGQSFTPIVISEKHSFRDIRVVDFDNDGDVDILTSGVIGFSNYQIDFWVNNLQTTNKFEVKNLLKNQNDFDGFNVLDINNDGALDIVVGLDQTSPVPSGLSVFISTGDINNLIFSEIKILDFPVGTLVETVLLGDFDNDGDQDFFHNTKNLWVENRFGTSSTDDNQLATDLYLSPNPVSDLLTVKIKTELVSSVMICDMVGNVIKDHKSIESKITDTGMNIDLSALQSGMYFLHISSSTAKVSKAFLKL
jgi:Secretion system C-terminal sorting domain/FG-GAP-like repeat